MGIHVEAEEVGSGAVAGRRLGPVKCIRTCYAMRCGLRQHMGMGGGKDEVLDAVNFHAVAIGASHYIPIRCRGGNTIVGSICIFVPMPVRLVFFVIRTEVGVCYIIKVEPGILADEIFKLPAAGGNGDYSAHIGVAISGIGDGYRLVDVVIDRFSVNNIDISIFIFTITEQDFAIKHTERSHACCHILYIGVILGNRLIRRVRRIVVASIPFYFLILNAALINYSGVQGLILREVIVVTTLIIAFTFALNDLHFTQSHGVGRFVRILQIRDGAGDCQARHDGEAEQHCQNPLHPKNPPRFCCAAGENGSGVPEISPPRAAPFWGHLFHVILSQKKKKRRLKRYGIVNIWIIYSHKCGGRGKKGAARRMIAKNGRLPPRARGKPFGLRYKNGFGNQP